jgi:Tfp pilus assembly protein PilV
LEVLVATVILAGSLIVLTELASIGHRHVRSADEWATAQRLCRTKIDEVAAGIEQAQNVENREFDGEPGWRYAMQSEATGPAGLTAVKVTVWRDVGENAVGAGKSGKLAASGNASASRDPNAPGALGPAASSGRSGSTRGSAGATPSRSAGGNERPARSFTLVRWLHKTSADSAGASTLPGGRRLPPGFRGGSRP